MKTARYADPSGCSIIYTVEGENYQYAILDEAGEHVLCVGTGNGHEDAIQPTFGNLQQTVQTWLRISRWVRPDRRCS